VSGRTRVVPAQPTKDQQNAFVTEIDNQVGRWIVGMNGQTQHCGERRGREVGIAQRSEIDEQYQPTKCPVQVVRNCDSKPWSHQRRQRAAFRLASPGCSVGRYVHRMRSGRRAARQCDFFSTLEKSVVFDKSYHISDRRPCHGLLVFDWVRERCGGQIIRSWCANRSYQLSARSSATEFHVHYE
jgi:hypothetical protein